MELNKICDGIFYIRDSTNLPLIDTGKGFILFDAPIDKDKSKKVIKILAENGIEVRHLVLSHHHADHTGGAYVLKNNLNLTLYAHKEERVFIENPILEPIYLSQGAGPPFEFMGKWVKSNPVVVDRALSDSEELFNQSGIEILNLPGHSIGLIGLKVNDVVFASDAFFSTGVLGKHLIPYFHDEEKYISSMESILKMNFSYILPSHGELYKREEGIKVVEENLRVVRKLEEKIIETISSPKNVEEILVSFTLPVEDFIVSYLIKSSLLSTLYTLMRRGVIKSHVENCVVYFYRV